jgi:carbonic anhydrase
VFFSVSNYSPNITDAERSILNTFFQQLRFETENPQVPRVSLGELMKLVDWENRWIYKGSHTIPPCEQYVYWNVIQKVYPIDAIFLE